MRVIASPAFKARAVNPYTWFLYEQMRSLGVEIVEFSRGQLLTGAHADIWHVHWPEGLLKFRGTPKVIVKLATFTVLLRWADRRRVNLIWTMHNLGSHERLHGRLEQRFWRAFIPRVDGSISLNGTGRRLALEKFPLLAKVPGFVIPHGHYRGLYPDTVSRAEARQHLGLASSASAALFIGQIRPYKNVTQLIRVFRQLRDRDAVLLLAGRPRSDDLREEMEHEMEKDARILGRLEFIPEEEMQLYLRAADLMVLPYQEILNSGAALLSLSFDCPVLARAKGALRELEANVGDEWVRLFENELTVQVLEDAFQWARHRRSRRPPLEAYDWADIVKATVKAYETVLDASCAGEG